MTAKPHRVAALLLIVGSFTLGPAPATAQLPMINAAAQAAPKVAARRCERARSRTTECRRGRLYRCIVSVSASCREAKQCSRTRATCEGALPPAGKS